MYVMYHEEIKVHIKSEDNLHNGLIKPDLINNYIVLLISNFIVLFSDVLKATMYGLIW